MAAFSLFRGTNIAVVTSCENREYVLNRICKPQCAESSIYWRVKFHVTSLLPYWCTKTNDLSLASFVGPPVFVHYTVVTPVSRNVANNVLNFLKWVHTAKNFHESTHLLQEKKTNKVFKKVKVVFHEPGFFTVDYEKLVFRRLVGRAREYRREKKWLLL